jgi:hypothetical protein
MAGIEVRTHAWPLILVKFDAEQTMDDCEAFIRAMEDVHARDESYASISYMKRYSSDRLQVRRIGEWMKGARADTARLCVGTGIITRSTTFRFLLSSIFLIKPMACPYQVCTSFADAFRFVDEQAKGRGVRVPRIDNPWSD